MENFRSRKLVFPYTEESNYEEVVEKDEKSTGGLPFDRYLLLFGISVAIGIIYGWSVKSIHTKKLHRLMMSDISMPLAYAFLSHYFIESKVLKQRLKASFTCGLGYATGTLVFLHILIKYH